ncbi:MAG: type II toxin-antitoxin system HicB family antitoxin [Candidatus Eremiobacterota bacterium]
MEVAVIIEKAPGNYCAYAPEVPGCIATGQTQDEALKNMQEALLFHFEGLIEDGEPLPEVTGIACQMVDVPVEPTLRKSA